MVNILKNYFSSNLKRLLKLKGANQQRLANFVDVKQTSISNWINGVTAPDLNNLVKIYQYFGLKSLDELVLKNLERKEVKLPAGPDNPAASADELLAAKDRIIQLQDEKISVLEQKLNRHPAVELNRQLTVAQKTVQKKRKA